MDLNKVYYSIAEGRRASFVLRHHISDQQSNKVSANESGTQTAKQSSRGSKKGIRKATTRFLYSQNEILGNERAELGLTKDSKKHTGSSRNSNYVLQGSS